MALPPPPIWLVSMEMAAASVAVPRYRRPAYSLLARPAASDSAYCWPMRASPRLTTSNPGEGVAPGDTIGMSRWPNVLWLRDTAMPPASVPSATSRLSAAASATRCTVTLGGSWLACTAARTNAGDDPATPIGTAAFDALPAKAKPRMAAMANGATRHVIRAERSRIRRRSSLAVMVQINGRPRRPVGVTARGST